MRDPFLLPTTEEFGFSAGFTDSCPVLSAWGGRV